MQKPSAGFNREVIYQQRRKANKYTLSGTGHLATGFKIGSHFYGLNIFEMLTGMEAAHPKEISSDQEQQFLKEDAVIHQHSPAEALCRICTLFMNVGSHKSRGTDS